MSLRRCTLALVAAGLGACTNPSPLDPPPPPPSPPLAGGAIAIDGVADEPAWQLRAQRGELDRGSITQVRLLRDAAMVYVFVDAIDRDLATRDAVDVAIGPIALHLAPSGPLPDGVARVVTGTLDDPHDDDVGVRYEVRVSIASLGAPPIAVRVSRCDPTCGSWTTSIEPVAP